jgi:hypothetical protein
VPTTAVPTTAVPTTATERDGREPVRGTEPAGSDGPVTGNGAVVTGQELPDQETAAPSGRHAATGRTPFRPVGVDSHSGNGGRRHRAGQGVDIPLQPGAGPNGAPAGRPEPSETDGLGLADLLAGALAAYRGI